jgi:hypothetical protein
MMSRWHSANVLQSIPGGRRLWRFSAKGDRFVLDGDRTLTLQEPAPVFVVGKNWQSFIRPKLNVAWLPADKVFFRAVQLPAADAAETASMVELQLEKLSPLPVTHIVWSLHLMPKPPGKPDALQTAIVIIAARSYVEEFLGGIQDQGFLADRIESPGLDQLLSVKMNEDGLWIFPGGTGEPVLLAWHYGGAIQDVGLLPLQEGPERAAQLKAHIERIAWAGEIEGWLTSAPRIHLVAGPEAAQAWKPLLAEWADNGVEIVAPAAPAELAAQSAHRTGNNGVTTNLLPPEYSARYHQQLVDRLWMRGLMAAAGLYVLVVLGYFAALFEMEHRADKAKQELAALAPAFAKAGADETQLKLLNERQQLKYAALDCWKAVADNLKTDLTLESLYFNRAKMDLTGSSSTDLPDDIYALNDGLLKSRDATRTNALFADVKINYTRVSGGRTTWGLTCALKNSEESR